MVTYETGSLVTSKAGHDKGSFLLIIRTDDEYVYLVDGKSRTMEKPKRKKKKHVQIIHYKNSQIAEKIIKREVIRDEDVRKVIRDYKHQAGIE